MLTKPVNALLLITIIVGVIFLIRETQRNRELRAIHEELAEEFGNFPIDDPEKIYVLALKSRAPFHFRWRVYLPPKYDARWGGAGGTSQNRSGGKREFIAAVRIRKQFDGKVRVFLKEDMGGGALGVGDEKLADFLIDRWDEIEITQLGSDGLVELDVSEVVTLLEVRMSSRLAAEAGEQFTNPWNKKCIPVLFRRQVATDKAYAAVAEQGSAIPTSANE